MEKKYKILLPVLIVIVVVILILLAFQLTTPKEDKREWMTEEPISVAVLMYLNENGYDLEDIRDVNTVKVRTSSSYILYQTTGQLRQTLDWYDFSVDVKVYADRVETVNFQIE